MTNQEHFHHLTNHFEASANPEKAEKMRSYMKNNFLFYGIPTPQRRQIYKQILNSAKKEKHIDWQLLHLAWAQPQREWHYFVCDYLIKLKTHIRLDDLPKLETFARTNQWWDSIDQLDEVYGALTLKESKAKSTMLTFAQDSNIWIRRIAINHQLGFKKQTDTQLLSTIINRTTGSNEFFINKAIGWALRDYSKHNPKWVKQFITEHVDQLSNLSIREASRCLN